MRKSVAISAWIFPAATKSDHIEQSTLTKRHAAACDLAQIQRVPFYTLRHTCLTRWASYLDPYSLSYFAGHSDFSTTRRYVYPDLETGRAAMERARGMQGLHNSGHSAEIEDVAGGPSEGN
jgi:integrase